MTSHRLLAMLATFALVATLAAFASTPAVAQPAADLVSLVVYRDKVIANQENLLNA